MTTYLRLTKAIVASLVAALSSSAAFGITANVISNPGDLIIQAKNGNTGNAAIAITPVFGAWQSTDPFGRGAVWISSLNSGLDGTSPDSGNDPFFTYRESIDLRTESVSHILSFTVWADDTASVSVNGSKVFLENLSQGGACADGKIGCEPAEGGFFELPLSAGQLHFVDIAVFQTGGDGMGVLLSGALAPVPIPATFLLLLPSLGVLGALGWRQRASLSSRVR